MPRQETPADTLAYVQSLIGYQFNDGHWVRQAFGGVPGRKGGSALVMMGRTLVELIALADLRDMSEVQINSNPFDRARIVEALGKAIRNSDVPKHALRSNEADKSEVLGDDDCEHVGLALLAVVYLDAGKDVTKVEGCLRAFGIGSLPSLKVS